MNIKNEINEIWTAMPASLCNEPFVKTLYRAAIMAAEKGMQGAQAVDLSGLRRFTHVHNEIDMIQEADGEWVAFDAVCALLAAQPVAQTCEHLSLTGDGVSPSRCNHCHAYVPVPGNEAETVLVEVPSIDTPEWRKIMSHWAGTDCDDEEATMRIVQLIDFRSARMVAAERNARNAELHDLILAKENLIQQAQQWAGEARAQHDTVLSILRHFGCPEESWHALELIKSAAPVASKEAVSATEAADWRENVASQCAATATSDIAASVLVDGGSGTLRALLNDAAAALRYQPPAVTEQPAAPTTAAEGVPSIQSPEFEELMGEYLSATDGNAPSYAAVVAHIDTKMAEAVRAAQEAVKPYEGSGDVLSEKPNRAIEWTPGPNEWKDWCTQYFGPDADDDYLAKAVFNLPPMAQRFARAALAQPAEPVTAAACDVLAERARQIGAEGWTAAHDDKYASRELSRAAACYALHTEPVGNVGDYLRFWPWPADWWKPTNYRRNLVKAGALILAEIERTDRAERITK
jgi:hypothetical protein